MGVAPLPIEGATYSSRDVGSRVCDGAGDIFLRHTMLRKHRQQPLEHHRAGDLAERRVWSEQLHGQQVCPQDALVIHVEDTHTCIKCEREDNINNACRVTLSSAHD